MVDKKPKGAKTPYACFVQVVREEHKKKHPDEQIVFSEFSKRCSEKWKEMSPKEKQRFMDIAAKDKERYLKEMDNYQPPAGTKNKRKIKDPNKPKGAWTAFFFFSDEHRKKIKEENPEYKVGDVAKVLGKMWEACKDKSKYEEQAKRDKERYNKELEEYKSGTPVSKKTKGAGDQVNGNHEDDDEEDDIEEDD
uniref:High mobility group-1 n=1 Tax=Schmidtea mediterranea TaxID=79327 RepID=I1ZIJ2_SCHMD|nr:high mobility group-1 [Schmidtea mediterranea]